MALAWQSVLCRGELPWRYGVIGDSGLDTIHLKTKASSTIEVHRVKRSYLVVSLHAPSSGVVHDAGDASSPPAIYCQ